MKLSESWNYDILSEVKWSEMFSLKISLKVKNSECEYLVSLSEVKWKFSPKLPNDVKLAKMKIR